jgi:hypothetical protein
MGIRQDFALMPAHAHLNLLGFVTLFLSALYYRVVPGAAASRLARYQAVVSVAGAVVFPIGIACVLLGGHDRFEPVVVAGALTVFLGMALFAVIVFRTSGQERAMPVVPNSGQGFSISKIRLEAAATMMQTPATARSDGG